MLVVNNLRDIPTDRVAGKRTLAVRLGDERTRLLYQGLVLGALVLVVAAGIQRPPALLGLIGALVAVRPVARSCGAAPSVAS